MVTISCAVGPESEKKSKLNYLSGEHYKSTVSVGALPVIIQGNEVSTKIEGRILLTEYNPLKFRKLLLQRDNETILETTTDYNGSFKFSGYLTNGEYKIIADSNSINFEAPLSVDRYEIKGLLFIIENK